MKMNAHTLADRAVSAALHTPNLGGPRCHTGPKIPVSSPLSTPEKASISQIQILNLIYLFIADTKSVIWTHALQNAGW